MDYEKHHLWTFRQGRDNYQEPVRDHEAQIIADLIDLFFWTGLLEALEKNIS